MTERDKRDLERHTKPGFTGFVGEEQNLHGSSFSKRRRQKRSYVGLMCSQKMAFNLNLPADLDPKPDDDQFDVDPIFQADAEL